MATTTSVTKKQYVCLCVAEQKQGFSSYKRGAVILSDYNLGELYSVNNYLTRSDIPAIVTLSETEIVVEYEMPSAEEMAAISLPIMEDGLQKLRADFVVAETGLLADIASLRQLTYKGPIEGDFVAAADSAKDVTPKDIDAEDAEIVEAINKIDKLEIPF